MGVTYSTGFKNFQYALISNGGYSAPVPLPGAMKISFRPRTASRTLSIRLSDGTISSTSKTADDGMTAQLAIIDLPEKFLKDVLGYVKAADSTLYEGKQTEVHFALLYETQGATEPTRHMLFDCVCIKQGYDATTKSSTPGIDTKSLELIMNPNTTAGSAAYGKYKRQVKRSDNTTLYDNWFGLVSST